MHIPGPGQIPVRQVEVMRAGHSNYPRLNGYTLLLLSMQVERFHRSSRRCLENTSRP